MAIYHFSAKVISRANGSSALAAAAYRSASRLHDQRLDRHHDFSDKAGVVHSEVLLPDQAPDEWRDREQLWNAVEAAEKRIDAQLAREIEVAIPREMTVEQGVALARDFVSREFVDRGMVADLNVHWDVGADGLAKPHAHVMLTTREVGEGGFGAKVRDWNRTELLNHWREAWADHVNERLAELDIDAWVDHRSLEAQGIDLEPQSKIGPAASRMAAQGLASERLVEHHATARANGDRIIAHPEIALDAITHSQATFTTRDLAMFVHRHSHGKDQFDGVMAAVRSSPELVRLGRDGRGQERFTSRAMLRTEQSLERATTAMAERDGHALRRGTREIAEMIARTRGLELGWEQQIALQHVTRPGDLKALIGYAGTGKSALLGIAREAWEESGYRVQGLALSGIAAENLEHGSGIASRTIASLEHQWAQGRDLLTSSDVLVIDEAGMIGTRQMERVLTEAEKRGAKVVLVGDPEQLQAIEAGAAFRATAERHGSVEITEIRRQRADWQRDATRYLATERTAEAISAYGRHDCIHDAETRNEARADLIDRWDRDRSAAPDASRIILTHTNDEVQALNRAARGRMRAAGQLGEDISLGVERGQRTFAPGDRVMFLKNERSLGVKNGSLGVVHSVTSARMAVMLDDGRTVGFDLKDYAHVDHGYAATIHKAQGVTVDRVHVLATPGLDRHAAYVALSRHRDQVDLHYGRDDFADRGKLVRTLSRERSKDLASDYGRDFADRRGIALHERAAEPGKTVPQKSRNMFDGLRLPTRPTEPQLEMPHQNRAATCDRVIARHARAVQAIFVLQDRGGEATPDMLTELAKARQDLNGLREHAARDAESAYARDPSLAPEAARGDTERARQATIRERDVRTNPELRAERFVERWSKLSAAADRAYVAGDYGRRQTLQDDMRGMARSLERDPQIESILANRKQQLGISFDSGRRLGAELAFHHGFDLSRDRSLGIGM